MEQKLEVTVLQPPQKNLSPEAYDRNLPVATIRAKSSITQIRVITSESKGVTYHHFEIIKNKVSDIETRKTSNYHKAMGIALCYATE